VTDIKTDTGRDAFFKREERDAAVENAKTGVMDRVESL